jgi:hypothetical protein
LQPLDVVLFGPLLRAYTVKLADYLQRSKGLLPVKKADFFLLFWDAYNTSFTRENFLKSFEATGVEPRNASVVLQRFTTPPPQLDDGTKLGEHGDGDTWRDMRKLFDAAVPDKTTVEAKRLSQALHSFQVKNEVVREENEDLRTSLNTKKKRAKKSRYLHSRRSSVQMLYSTVLALSAKASSSRTKRNAEKRLNNSRKTPEGAAEGP